QITDPAARLALLGQLASLRLVYGDLQRGLAEGREILASADPTLRAYGGFPTSMALAMLGRGCER
ncbi:MAG: hypothetical protein WBE38_18870, partial [Terracidiphilus sp.]